MTNKEMEKVLKNYIENLYEEAKDRRTEQQVKGLCGQAYGALNFAQEIGIMDDYHEGCSYWNLEMRPKFEELWLAKRK